MQRNLTLVLVLGALAAMSAQHAQAEGTYKSGASSSTYESTPAASSSSGATGSTSTADPSRSVGTTAADAAITAKVKSSLIGDELVKARNINVDTVSGKVSLTGNVKSQAEAQQAVQLAKQVSGVAEVQNNLKIQP